MDKSVLPYVTAGVAIAGASLLLAPVEALAAPTPMPQQPVSLTDLESLFGSAFSTPTAAAAAPAQATDIGGMLGDIFGGHPDH